MALRAREARARLAGAQKSTAGVPAYLRYVNRRLGGQVAALAYGLGATPTQITALSASLSVAGLAVAGTVRVGVPGAVGIAVLLAAGYAFDSADGQLARLRGGGTLAGEWLDHVVDAAKTCAVHLTVAIALFRFFDLRHAAWLLIPLAYLVVSMTHFFAMMLRDELMRRSGAGKPATPRASVLSSIVLLPVDYGTMCLCFLLIGTHTAFLVAYSLLGVAQLVFTVRALTRAYRELLAAR